MLTNNIEATRLGAEERLADLGFELRIAPWYAANPAAAELTQGLRLGADVPMAGSQDISAAVAELRMDLTPQELERFRKLGLACAAGHGYGHPPGPSRPDRVPDCRAAGPRYATIAACCPLST